MRDLPLNLINGVLLSNFVIVPSFNNYSETLQRVIVLMLLHTTDEELKLDNTFCGELVTRVTTGALSELRSRFLVYSDNVCKLMNQEEKSVKAISTDVNNDNDKIYITVNVTKADGTTETGEIQINEY